MRTARDLEAKTIMEWDTAPLRWRIFHIFDRGGVDDLEEPFFVTVLRYVALVFMMLVVTLSNVAIIISTLPAYADQKPPNAFTWINLVCVAYYTFEYFLRLFCTPTMARFLFDIFNIVDLLTIIPFYLQLAGVISEGFSNWILILRGIRIARGILYFKNFDIVTNTVAESSEVIVLMVFVTLIGLPLAGTTLYYAECTWLVNSTCYRECFPPSPCAPEPWQTVSAPDVGTERSPFQTSVDGMWFFIVTVTTLGFGDVSPTSRYGKLLGGAVMLVGVFSLAYPIMILSVNFEEERRKEEQERVSGKVQNGQRLRALQKFNTAVLSDGSTDFERPMPVFFYPREDNIPRQLILTSEEEVRYDPLFYVQRNRDGSLYMLQALKMSLEVSVRLVFDTQSAQNLALETIEYFSNEDEFKVTRARFFPVVRLYCSLDKPDHTCEFLKALRLVDHVIDNIDLDLMHIPIALELNGWESQLDDHKKVDFHQALHRCRLHVTALVAYEDPTYYDVPIFLGILSATALIRELAVQEHGVVYLTQSQIFSLINGVHHLIDLNSTEPVVIINTDEIRTTITKSIILRAASECDDPSAIPDDAFLYGRLETNEPYYGVFVKRLTKKASRTSDDAEYVLCNTKVLAVKPKQMSMTLVL